MQVTKFATEESNAQFTTLLVKDLMNQITKVYESLSLHNSSEKALNAKSMAGSCVTYPKTPIVRCTLMGKDAGMHQSPDGKNPFCTKYKTPQSVES